MENLEIIRSEKPLPPHAFDKARGRNKAQRHLETWNRLAPEGQSFLQDVA